MGKMRHIFGVAAMGLLLTGCVSQEKYNAMKLDRDRLTEQLATAQTEAAAAKAEADALRGQIGALMSKDGNGQALVTNLTQQNAELQRQLEEINRRYAELAGKVGQGTALPPELSNELEAFARQNPDLIEFDASRGIVKFKSDVTFALGSADLTPKAKEVIGRFSQILNSAAASGYELMVAGHTDNMPVSRPETKAAGHKDNWYLSAHRAISVGQELLGQRVNPQRLAVVGYADQRPVASNGSEAGRAQNRRVEVLILPTTVRSGAPVAPAAASSGNGAAPALNKDGNTTPRASGPSLNK